MARGLTLLAVLAAWAAVSVAAPGQAQGEGPAAAPDLLIQLDLPVDCTIGEDCRVLYYPSRPMVEAQGDYMCGSRVLVGGRATGIVVDTFPAGLRTTVRAAAPGVVIAARDGQPDISTRAPGAPSVKGVECGNGVLIAHAGDWSTRYCHLAKGTVTVAKGDTVERGQSLGRIGLSGNTEHAHLSLMVRWQDIPMDPFTAEPLDERCGHETGVSLWTPRARAALGGYHAAEIVGIGFADQEVDSLSTRAGAFAGRSYSPEAGALLLYADLVDVARGDSVHFVVSGPDGSVVVNTRKIFDERSWKQWFGYAGKRVARDPFPPGVYSGTVVVERPGLGIVARRETSVTLQR